jgi:acetate kinase
MTDKKNILVINAGSSSDKISFFQLHDRKSSHISPQKPDWQTEVDFPSGDIDSINWQQLLTDALQPLLHGEINNASNQPTANTLASDKFGIDKFGSDKLGIDKVGIDIIGHRVVHGGDKYSSAVIIDDQVKKDIEKYIPLAPLHNKVSLLHINALEKLLPDAKQIAVFDTAFHRTLPDTVSFYPVPYEWHEKYGIKRFGFHGINHQYCSKQAAHMLQTDIANFSVITCHLGSGCSLAAIENGKSVNTTMGFTPLEGLMMASRSGSIDPSILLYLLKNKKMTIDELETTLNKNSGLKGISQISADMKVIIEKMQSNTAEAKLAQLAFDMFINRLRSGICSMRASLSKLDAVVFTAGIGEHSSLVREKACAGLDFLGLELDKNANENAAPIISLTNSKTKVLVIKAREDWEIAQQSLRC